MLFRNRCIPLVLLVVVCSPRLHVEARSNPPRKQALSDEYYEWIEQDPDRAGRARDQYMRLVNHAGARPPFFSFVISSQWPGSLDEDQFPAREGTFPARHAQDIMIAVGADILKISPFSGS